MHLTMSHRRRPVHRITTQKCPRYGLGAESLRIGQASHHRKKRRLLHTIPVMIHFRMWVIGGLERGIDILCRWLPKERDLWPLDGRNRAFRAERPDCTEPDSMRAWVLQQARNANIP